MRILLAEVIKACQPSQCALTEVFFDNNDWQNQFPNGNKIKLGILGTNCLGKTATVTIFEGRTPNVGTPVATLNLRFSEPSFALGSWNVVYRNTGVTDLADGKVPYSYVATLDSDTTVHAEVKGFFSAVIIP